MVDFTKLAATAKRLVEKNGRSVTLVSDNTTAANPALPELGPDFSTGRVEEIVIAAFVPSAGTGFGSSIAQSLGGEVLQGFDEVALIAATSLSGVNAIGVFDRLRDGTDLWKIAKVDILKPASIELLFQLGLNR